MAKFDLGTRVAIYLLHAIAQIASVTRLIYRARTRRLWWDDFWAFVSMAFDITMVTLYVTREAYGMGVRDARRAVFLIAMTSVLWAARLSIAVTIVRLVPLGPGRLIAKAMSGLFALMWCGLLVNKLFICQSRHGGTLGTCRLPPETGIVELVTDLTADIWLICSPAYLLWDVKLNHRRQILIFSVFASDILLAIASVVHSVFLIQQKRPDITLSALIELSISLIICNLLVLVTWVYSHIYPPDRETVHAPDSVNYPTTASAFSRSRRVNAPRYGFDGSVLALTDLSTPSISIFSTFDNPSTRSSNEPWSKPRSHSLNALWPVIPMPRETFPSYLRPTKSCPALFHSVPVVTAYEKVGNGCDEMIKWKNIQFDTRAAPAKRSPSMALSSESGARLHHPQAPDGRGERPYKT